MGALLTLQAVVPVVGLAEYGSASLTSEMSLFRDWFLTRHLALPPDEDRDAMLSGIFAYLQANALEQPQIFVHRDYHSRNLMVYPDHNPGILDFQDAVRGPVTYDLVSLLKDVYIEWPREWVDAQALGYRELAIWHGIMPSVDEATWLRWFDLMGVQRHLKVAGIFARLYHRDGKAGYLTDIPLTLRYLIRACRRYPELARLQALLTDHRILRRVRAQNARILGPDSPSTGPERAMDTALVP